MEGIRAIMKAEPNSFLVTLDEAGSPRARILAAVEISDEFRVIYFTNADTRKANEIRRDPRVTLAFWHKGGNGYVNLMGTAKLITDPWEKRKYWQEGLGEFFPGGPGGTDAILIEVMPSRIELMSFPLKIATEPFKWLPMILTKGRGGWELEK